VSRPKRPREVRWREQGVERVQRIIEKEPTVASTAPPTDRWLVAMYDPTGHLVAVLAVNGENAPPVVYEANEHGAPTLVLLPDGLAMAYVSPDSDGRLIVAPVGTPRAEFPVRCWTCQQYYPLYAEHLHSARGTESGRPARLAVTSPA
jgi:hypothetical protein